MKQETFSRNLLRLTGLTQERVLLAVFVLYLACAAALLVFLRYEAERTVREAALIEARQLASTVLASRSNGIAEGLAAGADFTPVPGLEVSYVPAAEIAELPPADASLIARLRASAEESLAEFEGENAEQMLNFAAADAEGNVVILVQDLAMQFRTLEQRFQRFYIAASMTGLAILGGLAFAALSLRRTLYLALTTPDLNRQHAIRAALRERDIGKRINRLPWIVAACLVIFIIDLEVQLGTAIATGYVLAVLIGLWSDRTWHTYFAAALGTGLAVLKLAVSPWPEDLMWMILGNRTLSIFAIWTTALLGIWQLRKGRLESEAQAEAAQAHRESSELRSALERAAATEAELRRSQTLRQIVGRIAKIGGWELEVATGKRTWSEDVRRIFELPLDEPPDPGKVMKLYDPEARRQLTQAVEAARMRGQSWDLTLPATSSSGRRIWVRSIGEPEFADGGVERIAGAVQDVTDVRAAEENRTELLERLALATSTAGVGIFDWNPRTRERTWDERNYQLWGLSPGSPVDDVTLHALIHPEDLPRVRDGLDAALNDGRRQHSDTFRIRHRSGLERVLERQAVVFRDGEGQPQRMLGMTRDVTESHRAAEELRAAKNAAEAATRTKSAFLANVSHEIRTPMNGVIGMTDLLLETTLDPTQREYSETIRSSAEALLTVINDLLDFSKIEAGRLEIETIDMDLRANVEDVGATMAFQAAAKNLELIVNVRPEVPDRVFGDPQRIRQCLINLVGNAIKFTRTGEVTVDVCLLGRREGRALVHFEVRDTGIGIAPDTLAVLFQPFTQADVSTTRHFGGTGLGLSIVSRLVEMMEGQVGAESAPGHGSTFWFTLPLEPNAVEPAGSRPSTGISGRRVLVVDDNATNRRVLLEQLTHAGYEVMLAENGRDALATMRQALANSRHFDVVLADFQMPDMDGAALAVAINGDPHLADARLVMLTSIDRHGDIGRFARLGFAAYLAKPVRSRELLTCLSQVLAREAREWQLQSQPMVTRTLLTESTQEERYDGHVLLVEDNVVNQKVAQRFLERLGCLVTTVDDGAAAVEACRRGKYDLILMDMQMPVMDGLTATREIRSIEAVETGGRTPIVALTANAMPGQLEQCLTAGMDACLTKPLDIDRLKEALARNGLRASEAQPDSTLAEGPPPADLGRLLELTAGDRDFARELSETFARSSATTVASLTAALATRDRPTIRLTAHQLKGASANIHAALLKDLAAMLEERSGLATEAELKDLVELLQAEMQRVNAFLQEKLA